VELPGVAAVSIAAGTLPGIASVRIQATQDAVLATLFQITGSAALPTHRVGYEVRVNLGSQQLTDKTIPVTLTIPDSLLAVGTGTVIAFVRYIDLDPEDAVDTFDPVDATADLATKTVTVTLSYADFFIQPDGSNEAQIILALTTAGRSHQSRVPGSRPSNTNPDTCGGFTVFNLSNVVFASSPLSVPLVITSRMGCRESTNTPTARRRPHKGVDLRAQTPVPVLAVADGYLEQVVYFSQTPTTLGNFVRIRHQDGAATEYLHLSEFSNKLKGLVTAKIYAGPGGAAQIKAGDQLGLSGTTSTVSGLAPHLHFQLRLPSGGYVNPEDFLVGASKDQPGLISEFLFRANEQDFVTSDALLPISLDADKSVSLELKAKDSVFRDVTLPTAANLTATVTPADVATATITGGSVVITGKAAGMATIRVEYVRSAQKPNKAWGSIRLEVKAALSRPPSNPTAGQEWTNPKDGSVLIWVPGGTFQMGTNDFIGAAVHSVTLSGFWMGKHEVTVGQYRAYCTATGRSMPTAPSWGWIDSHPMVRVSWEDAVAYGTWSGLKLPTEAQWEYAASGGDGRKWPWGNTWDSSRCINWGTRLRSTAPVGSCPSGVSPFGMLDMAGNVWEWCGDWLADYTSGAKTDPSGPGGYPYYLRVQRGGAWVNYNDGGSWYVNADNFRCAYRSGGDPTEAGYYFDTKGFRLSYPLPAP
jgi:formylglycine-generating enzyme required for sulfatase activity